MPAKPAALKLSDRSYERIIVLDPRADAPPKIALTSPLRDTTLRAPRLVVQLNATATDDIGLNAGHFEYLITTGSGEVFSARTITTPVIQFGGSRNGSLSVTLDLASLKLGEGDVVSMRAIAQDGNTLSGPGVATSDTRTIRIARAGEYDSLSIEAAAPQPIDSSAMSQRMLIVMTEKLVREQPKLTRQELVKRSTEIGDLEDRIRKESTKFSPRGVRKIPAHRRNRETCRPSRNMEGTDEFTEQGNPDLERLTTRSGKRFDRCRSRSPRRHCRRCVSRSRHSTAHDSPIVCICAARRRRSSSISSVFVSPEKRREPPTREPRAPLPTRRACAFRAIRRGHRYDREAARARDDRARTDASRGAADASRLSPPRLARRRMLFARAAMRRCRCFARVAHWTAHHESTPGLPLWTGG